MFGLILSGFISERLGRKKCLILVSVLQILTSVAIHFSTSYLTLLVALTFSGGLNSMVLTPSFSFLSEIALIREVVKVEKKCESYHTFLCLNAHCQIRNPVIE